MKKFLPLVMCLLATVLISACSQSDSKVDGLSSIEIVLPDGPALQREIETENKQTIYNFLLTVSNEASENDSVSNTGKSGEKLKVEVKPGIYFVKLQAFALEDTELADVLYEASEEHVEVFAGKVTKVFLELSKILSETEKGNVEVSVFDTANISITGKEVLEIDDFDKEYSTLKIPGASYVWSWDGEEVVNENDETCVINTSALSSVDAGVHTLKVEIEYNGVWADAVKEIRILPTLGVFYNKDSGAGSTVPEYKIFEIGGVNELNENNKLGAFCFDNDNSYYTLSYESNSYEYKINKYFYNFNEGFIKSEIEKTLSLEGKYISRIASDGNNLFFVTRTVIKDDGEEYEIHSQNGIYFDSEKDKANLYMLPSETNEPVLLDVSKDFTVVTAVAYEKGYLYVAGYNNTVRIVEESYTSSNNETITTTVSDNLYMIVKYPFENGIFNNNGEIIESYYDHDIYGDKPLETVGQKVNSSVGGVVRVNNLITDLIVKNGCIYALRSENFALDGDYLYRDFSFSVMYKDSDSKSFLYKKLEKNAPMNNNGNVYNCNIFPVKIIAVRRKELDLGIYDYPNGVIASVDLSCNDSTLFYKTGEYGFYFDQVSMGSNLDVEFHPYQAGNFEASEQEPSN